jgi:predicted TIM-barrel enzyme
MDDEYDENEESVGAMPYVWYVDVPIALLGVVVGGLTGLAEGLSDARRVLAMHSLYTAKRKMNRDTVRAEMLRDIEAIVAGED